MHPLFRFSGPFRWLVLLFCVVGCGLAASAQTTTFTGTVYSPLGAPPTGTGDPIPNILVFVVAPGYPPPTFTQGLTTPQPGQTGCEAQPDLVPRIVLGQAITDAAGKFIFTTSGPLPADVDVVIQAGKWRRQYHNTPVTLGGTTAPLLLSMPASQADGDLPHIAVVTGSADSVECIFQQIGIDPTTEITDPTGTGSINFYQGATGPGQYISTNTPKEAALVADPATLQKYDVVIFGCQGNNKEADATATNLQNMEAFTNMGGRMFATHYGYLWLDNSAIPDFKGTAEWDLNAYSASSTTLLYPSLIDTSYPEGKTLAAWMTNIGALYNNTPDTIGLQQVRVDTTKVNNPPAQSWVTLNHSSAYSGTGNPSMQFTFDTPIGAAGMPTVSLAYSNVTTTFLQGDPSDSVNVIVTNTSTTPTQTGLVLTIAIPSGITVTSIADISGGNWSCNLNSLTCTNSGIAAGAVDSVGLIFSVDSNASVGTVNLTASLSGGGLSSSGQCGRVLFNDYHVEKTSGNVKYPADCSTGLTVQEKFLEFSLYNLSNFVSPNTSDSIDIQGPTTISWSTPSPIYYGTALSGTQLNATAIDNVTTPPTTVPGNIAYNDPVGTVLNAGTYSGSTALTATFTPNIVSDYTTPVPVSVNLTVLPDPTTTNLTIFPINPPAGTTVVMTAVLTDTYFSPVPGTVTFYDGAAVLGTSTLNVANTATFSISTFSLGSHHLMACFNASNNFVGSCSTLEPELITIPTGAPSSTTTLVASNLDPSVVGQSVTFTATIASTGSFVAIPSGPVNFLDGTTVIGSGTVTNGVATFTTSTLTAGLHNITAVYAGGTAFVGSTSVVVAQQVNTSLTSAGAGFLMTVSPTTFTVAAGASFNAGITVLEFNNFNQPITLSCSGLPAEATCSFGTTTIPGAGGATPVTVSIASPHNCGTNSPYYAESERRGLPILALVTFLFFARRRRALKGLLLAAMLCIIPAVSGCSNCTDLGVRPGVYTFTITGTPASSGPSPVNVVNPNDPITTTPQSQTMTMNVTI